VGLPETIDEGGVRGIAFASFNDMAVDDYAASLGSSPGHITPLVSLTLTPR
jgi:hypothetical protein